jgi:hypothetical protein
MNKIAVIFSLLLLLCSCDGSDDYQGTWKALDSKGKKFEIIFEARLFSIIDSTRTIKNYPYTQHSFKHENSIDTYGIRLQDGRGYEIFFPKNDKSVGIIKDETGSEMFTISRTKYLTTEDMYKLN